MFKDFNFEIHDPWFLLLFLLFIPLIFMDLIRKKRNGITVPTIKNMKENKSFLLVLFLLKISKYIILSSLIIAIARPRTFTVSDDKDDTKGVDIMITADVSPSMLARDLEPDRLSALKKIAKNFIEKRTNDRIGLVAFSGEAFPKVPVTSDHNAVLDELANLKTLELMEGTAIGEGLAVAVNHLKNSKAKSKIIILMTDGENNILNALPPQTAAELAKNNRIKVYTIGIGTNGYALFPAGRDVFGDVFFQQQEVKIDEAVLREIAETTGGKYFRATSNTSLERVYDEINNLEKSDVKINRFYNYYEYFHVFLWIAFFTLLLDALLRWVFYKTIL